MIESLAKRVKGIFGRGSHYREKLSVITCAASLAHHRLLGSVRWMRLRNDDLTSVPTEHLASLASNVTGGVTIRNVSGCDLVSILDSIRIKGLSISRQRLGGEETQALVRAMESCVEIVKLNHEVKLDIKVLIEYSGQKMQEGEVSQSCCRQIQGAVEDLGHKQKLEND